MVYNMALLKGVTSRLIMILPYGILIYLILIIKILYGHDLWVCDGTRGVDIV